MKDVEDEEEFFRPYAGLELAPYMAANDMSGTHHLARYHWVKLVLKDFRVRRIIDVACGAGYGSYILAKFLPDTQITGADYDARAVEVASGTYQLPNLRFVQADIMSWTDGEGRDLGAYDAVVSFDTIEHIEHRDIALLRIAENLTGIGLLALSTPCAHSETQFTPEWRPHKIEYSHRDLKALLRRFFSDVFAPEDGTLPHMSYWTDVVNKGESRYLNLANPLICIDPIK